MYIKLDLLPLDNDTKPKYPTLVRKGQYLGLQLLFTFIIYTQPYDS